MKNYDSGRDRKIRPVAEISANESECSVQTVRIKGMMCAHCEGRVKNALEELDGVEEATVSHEKGTAELKLSAHVDSDKIKKAVENAGYKFQGVK